MGTPNYPPYPQPGVPPQKKTSPIVWVLAILGVLFFLLLAIAGAGVWYVKHRIEQAGGFDKANPTLTAVRIAAAMNPDIEVLSSNTNGTVRIRQKSTGKVATVDLQQIQQGKITWESEDGEGKSSMTIGGGPAKLPAWVPNYPGSDPKSAFSTQAGDRVASSVQFSTSDAPAKVAEFYSGGLKESGMKVTKTESADATVVQAQDEDRSRNVVATIREDGGKTEVQVSYSGKK